MITKVIFEQSEGNLEADGKIMEFKKNQKHEEYD